ncbi:SDR family NAD(P)-dependent oxidoreductase [Ruegeria meonggei]|uniref:SDR family NAD(P)-dependent oxidoreductase n=1 Tax=Ruegeria meonggei TaxID=1446476 RepID=UPI00367126D3
MTKTIAITGAASGIGLAIAQRMAREGWSIGMIDLSVEALQAAAETVTGGQVITIAADVTDASALRGAFDHITTQTGALHAVCNNAGILRGGAFAEAPLADHHSQIEVNIKGVVNGAYLAFPHLQKTQGPTHLINTCSVSAIYGAPNVAVYSSTKGFVRHLTDALSLEWEEHGIAFQAIWPPVVKTPLIEAEAMQKVARKHGIDMGPEGVATEVAQMLSTYKPVRVHRVQTLKFRCLYVLQGLLPGPLFRAMVRALA